MKHGDKLSYMKGDLLYSIWPKPESTETRLLVYRKDIHNIIEYDYKSYEETMFFHNKYTRAFGAKKIPEKFKSYIWDKNWYCSCYDCLSELKILNQYSLLFKLDFNQVVTIFGYRMNKNNELGFQKNYKHITLPLKNINFV